jgi:hypothetical protein
MRRKKEMAWNFILPILRALRNGENWDEIFLLNV